MATRITQDELLEAIAETLRLPAPDDATTVNEICEARGRSKPVVLAALRKLKQQGRLDAVPVVREAIDGRLVKVVAYRLKPAPRKK